MSIGLIMIDKNQDIEQAVSLLIQSKNTWIDNCDSYIVHSTYSNEDVMMRLSLDDEISKVTYGVTDDENIDIKRHFNKVITLNGHAVNVFDLG